MHDCEAQTLTLKEENKLLVKERKYCGRFGDLLKGIMETGGQGKTLKLKILSQGLIFW